MGFLETLKRRGQVAQVTHEDELAEHLAGGRRTAYIGFDPSAPSLHVGSLLQIMGLRRWQAAGHRVVALVGGGTAMIGDPTGKTEMRKMLSEEDIERNIQGIRGQLEAYLDLSSPDKGVLVNNADWLMGLQYLPLLRDVGPHFSVNRMLTAECFKQRLEKGLSFLEFNYMILQSYDFLHLFREQGCTVQMGGDDQWSNMLGGMELIRRVEDAQAYCLTMPLMTTSDGSKMGKTERGAIWLDRELTSPYDYFQFWRNVEDAMVRDCLAFYTELPMDEVERLASREGAGINEAKKLLAYEATKMLHGEDEAAAAQRSAEQLFSGGGAGGSEPVKTLPAAEVGEGLNIMEFLVKAGVFASKGEVRRLIQQGGLLFNGEKVSDIGRLVTKEDVDGEEGCLVRKGKKHYFRIRFSN